MKKLLTVFLIIIAAISTACAFTACDLFRETDLDKIIGTLPPEGGDEQEPSKPSQGDEEKEPSKPSQGGEEQEPSKPSQGDEEQEPSKHVCVFVEKTGTEGHWTECDCGEKTAVTPHVYKEKTGTEGHWTECDCGEKTAVTPHIYVNYVCACGAEAPEYASSNIQSASISHEHGDGNYLWFKKDTDAGIYNFYGAQWEITLKDGVARGGDNVAFEPVSADQLVLNGTLRAGKQEVTLKLDYLTETINVFVYEEGHGYYLDGVSGQYEVNGLTDNPILFSDGAINDLSKVTVTGTFNMVDGNGTVMSLEYYGVKEITEENLVGFANDASGKQLCDLKINLSEKARPLTQVYAVAYDQTVKEQRIYISGVNIGWWHQDMQPEAPHINVGDFIYEYGKMKYGDLYHGYISEKIDTESYPISFEFKIADCDVYTSDGEEVVIWGEAQDLKVYDNDVNCERDVNKFIQVEGRDLELTYQNKLYKFTYYAYSYNLKNDLWQNIKFCRVAGRSINRYTLDDQFTVESVKQDLLNRFLYVEYFQPVNGRNKVFIPIEDFMLEDFDDIDANTFEEQSATVKFGVEQGVSIYNWNIAIRMTKEYSVKGAKVVRILTSDSGECFILSEATKNDFSKHAGDKVKEIFLYDNGCAVLKHEGNGLGDFKCGYVLDGNLLKIDCHGDEVAYLTLTDDKFTAISDSEKAGGKDSEIYVYEGQGWTAVFTAYDNGSNTSLWYYYLKIELKDSVSNETVEYQATWAIGRFNNRNCFVAAFANGEMWFNIGVQDSQGRYKLEYLAI